MEIKPTVTVSQVLDRYERECIPLLSPRTARDYVRHVGHLRRLFGHFVADDMKPRDFGEFINVQGKGKIQRNRQLAVLSAAFSQAVGRWYWMERNVLRDVKRNPSSPRNRYVTNEEYDRCKSMSPLRVQLMMELALLTGQRQGDLLAMEWAHVKDMMILFTQSKTGKRWQCRSRRPWSRCSTNAGSYRVVGRMAVLTSSPGAAAGNTPRKDFAPYGKDHRTSM